MLAGYLSSGIPFQRDTFLAGNRMVAGYLSSGIPLQRGTFLAGNLSSGIRHRYRRLSSSGRSEDPKSQTRQNAMVRVPSRVSEYGIYVCGLWVLNATTFFITGTAPLTPDVPLLCNFSTRMGRWM